MQLISVGTYPQCFDLRPASPKAAYYSPKNYIQSQNSTSDPLSDPSRTGLKDGSFHPSTYDLSRLLPFLETSHPFQLPMNT